MTRCASQCHCVSDSKCRTEVDFESCQNQLIETKVLCGRQVAVVGNKDVRGETPITQLLANDFWGTPFAHARSHKCYRPLTVLSFRANFFAARWLGYAGLEPAGYHAVNIICSAIVVFLAAVLLQQLFPSENWADQGEGVGQRRTGKGVSFGAVVGAFTFAAHPVHSEAIANVVGRAELLSAIFALSSFLTFVNALPGHTPARPAPASSTSDAQADRQMHSTQTTQKPMLATLKAAGLGLMAGACKETGLTVLAINLILAACHVLGLVASYAFASSIIVPPSRALGFAFCVHGCWADSWACSVCMPLCVSENVSRRRPISCA